MVLYHHACGGITLHHNSRTLTFFHYVVTSRHCRLTRRLTLVPLHPSSVVSITIAATLKHWHNLSRTTRCFDCLPSHIAAPPSSLKNNRVGTNETNLDDDDKSCISSAQASTMTLMTTTTITEARTMKARWRVMNSAIVTVTWHQLVVIHSLSGRNYVNWSSCKWCKVLTLTGGQWRGLWFQVGCVCFSLQASSEFAMIYLFIPAKAVGRDAIVVMTWTRKFHANIKWRRLVMTRWGRCRSGDSIVLSRR